MALMCPRALLSLVTLLQVSAFRPVIHLPSLASPEGKLEQTLILTPPTKRKRWEHGDIWRTLRRTGRHGWRHKKHDEPKSRPETPDTKIAVEQSKFNDWCFFMIVTAFVMTFQALQLYRPSSIMVHAISLMLCLMVGIGYCALTFMRAGSDDGLKWATGYLLELVNCTENVFILHSIAKAFQMPLQHTRKVIFFVMLSQIVFDTVFFMGFANWLRHLRPLPYILGVWLLCCGGMVAMGDSHQEDEYAKITDTLVVRTLQKCFPSRFWASFDDYGNLLVIKGEQVVITLLGPVLCCFVLADFLLEADVTLTKIEEIPDLYVSYTSSVIASCALSDFFFVARQFLLRFPALRFGVGLITVFFGFQMLASEFYMVPAAANCVVMVSVVSLCCVYSSCWERPVSYPEEMPAKSAIRLGVALPEKHEPPPQEGS